MRIAVAVDERGEISRHFGHSAGYLVFTVEDLKVTERELRPASGLPHTHDHHGGDHSHAAMIELLQDCSALFCGGIGARAVRDLRDHQIMPYVVHDERRPESAVNLFLAGAEMASDATGCDCHGNCRDRSV